jgi:hypothetical protein
MFTKLSILTLSIIIVSTAIGENIPKTNAQNTTNQPLTQNIQDFPLQLAKAKYQLAWNQSGFHSDFDAFVIPGSVQAYGIYDLHPSTTFKKGETIELYVQPVGYAYKLTGADERGLPLYLMNFTANISVDNLQGKKSLGIQNLPVSALVSHNKNSEVFLTLLIAQKSPLPPGQYKVTYIVKDVSSGQSFTLVKNILIANSIKTGILR